MAADKVTRGDARDVYLMGDPNGGSPSGAFTDTTPQTSVQDELMNVDGLSLHLIVDFQIDQIAVIAGTDGVNAGTGVWSFGNYTFTGKTGAKLIVTGAANAGNNVGTLAPPTGLAISAVTANTATTATTGLVTETFGPNVAAYVIRAETASVPQGGWKIYGSNDFATAGNSGYGQPAYGGNWPEITAMFTIPATIAAVTTASSQIVQPSGHFSIKSLRAVFTPTAGNGTARVARFAKSWSR